MKKWKEELNYELSTFNYEDLYKAAKEYYGGNVNFSKTIRINGKILDYQRLMALVILGSHGTRQEYIDISLWMSTYVSKCMNDTIDAAKTGYRVYVLYLEKFEKSYRSGAVLAQDYAEIKMARGKLALNAAKLSIRGHKKEMCKTDREELSANAIRTDRRDGEEIFVVEDFLTNLRNKVCLEVYEMLKQEIGKNIVPKISGYQTKDVRLNKTLSYLSSIYTNCMRNNNIDKGQAKRTLVNMARSFCRKTSLKPEDYFKEVYKVSSNKDKDGTITMNGFYLAFTPEAIQYYVETYCPDAKLKNKVYKFGAGEAYLGQKITFTDGISKDGFYAETNLTGTYTLTINSNCEPIVERPVKEMIPPVQHDATAIAFELKSATLAETKGIMEKIEKARTLDVPFSIRYVNSKGEIVPTFKNAHLWLFANKTKIAEIYIHDKNMWFENALQNRCVSIEQVAASEREYGKSMIIVTGHETGMVTCQPVTPVKEKPKNVSSKILNLIA